MEAPGIRHDGDTPLASAELSVVIDLPKEIQAGLDGECADAWHPAGHSEGAP